MTFTLLTNPQAAQVANTLLSVPNLEVKAINVRKEYKGIIGLYRLYRVLRQENYDAIADLHDVLRSKILRFFFKFSGVKNAVIDKGRKEKKLLIKHEIHERLKDTFSRYMDVFSLLGLGVKLTYDAEEHRKRLSNRREDNDINIGIAPHLQVSRANNIL